MGAALDTLIRAFFQHEQRLAVFDPEARRLADQWEVAEPIPVTDILALFADTDALAGDEAVILPLHEPETAEVTGEYLRYTPAAGTVEFFDYSRETIETLDVSTIGQRYPAWRLRYWHPTYSPPETPSYLEDLNVTPSSLQVDTGSPPEQPSLDAEESISDVKLFIERERDGERDARLEEYERKSLSTYTDEYGGIRALKSVGRRVAGDGGQICMLQVRDRVLEDGEAAVSLERDFGIHEGAEVLVDTRTDLAGFPVQATVVGTEGRQLDLRVKWATSASHSAAEAAFDVDADHRFQLVPLVNPLPYDRLRDGVDAIEADAEKLAILTGERSLNFDHSVEVRHYARGLNQYQEGALRNAVGAADIFCIHGPPGTGKTRTLTAIIKAAVDAGDRVLACAHSNQAVDHLLVGTSTPDKLDRNSLHAAAQDDEFVMARAGSNSENPVVTSTYMDTEFWEATVVGATASAAHQFRTNEFDLVVMDEASQATIPATLLPWSRGDRLVLAGDHKQLPPYTSQETAEQETIEISLLEHFMEVYEDQVSTMLQKQYRMNEAIAAFPNREFYDGQLTHGQRNRDWTVRGLPALEAIQVDGGEQRTPFGSYYNEEEAVAVRREIARLKQHAVVPDNIGVITPYSGQVGKIVQAIDDPELEERIKVSTVDAFQGSEREAIIVSFVRSNPDGNIGFLSFPVEGPRRLNVALTRAKRRCVLIGDWGTLAGGQTARETAVYARLRSFLDRTGVLRQPA